MGCLIKDYTMIIDKAGSFSVSYKILGLLLIPKWETGHLTAIKVRLFLPAQRQLRSILPTGRY